MNKGYKSQYQTNGIDWAAIFERRPDLTPPGYDSVIAEHRKLNPERYPNHDQKQS